MKRNELKQILSTPNAESRKLYRMYPDLFRALIIWEDYLQELARFRKQEKRAAKNAARYAILEYYHIGENTFYHLHSILQGLCEDVDIKKRPTSLK